MKGRDASSLFIMVALFSLITGTLFGVIGGMQYLLPEFLQDHLGFSKVRPLHVSLVITWIFTAAIGGIYHYLPEAYGRRLFSDRLAIIHFIVFIVTGSAILMCYLAGKFGGREYFEFPPVLAFPMLITWVLFTVNFFMTLKGVRVRETGPWSKVYTWMWCTGIIFFSLTFIEQYLWLIPFFRDNFIRDITIQWKSMGTLVGSWNQLVYGTGFYIMEKISGNDKISRAPITFILYFTGLVNLMFNWGHHTYIVPAAPYIKEVSYIISMTELLILGSIIWNWKKTLNDARRNFNLLPYRFLSAADLWIFINLILAILISVPAINLYTHGTHITVAHAMGATIGINTMMMLASLYWIAGQRQEQLGNIRRIKSGFWLANGSLLVFWLALIGAGISRSIASAQQSSFSVTMQTLRPYFYAFMISGLFLFAGIIIISIPLLRFFLKSSRIE